MGRKEMTSTVIQSSDSQSSTPMIVAIDGPAGAGKSTIASMLAERLGVPYLDTGSMYRAVALLALREEIKAPLDEEAVARVTQLVDEHQIQLDYQDGELLLTIDGEDASSAIRSPECAMMASAVSAVPDVRRRLVALQRAAGKVRGGVLEGRDITSVVFPDADLRVFLTATPTERAKRRLSDIQKADNTATLDQVLSQQKQRDRQDTTREDSPLHVARGVVVVDTTGLTPEQVVERLLTELQSGAENGA
jgi:cytidylate kinase